MTDKKCAVEGCDRTNRITKGWCWTHYMRWYSKGEVGPAKIENQGQGRPVGGDRHPNYLGNSVGYSGAHRRIRDMRGPAKYYRCAHCKKAAKHWAYDRDDPNELTGPEGPYSALMTHYIPLCVSCHRIFDAAAIGGWKRAPRSHCLQGHELTESNTILRSDGRRRCRTCANERRRSRRRKSREVVL